MKDKIESYLGFSIKKGSVVFGLESIECYRKRMYVIFLSCDVGKNTEEKTKLFAQKKNIPLILTKQPLNEILKKTNVKVLAITDTNLSKAILENTNVNYKLYSEV